MSASFSGVILRRFTEPLLSFRLSIFTAGEAVATGFSSRGYAFTAEEAVASVPELAAGSVSADRSCFQRRCAVSAVFRQRGLLQRGREKAGSSSHTVAPFNTSFYMCGAACGFSQKPLKKLEANWLRVKIWMMGHDG